MTRTGATFATIGVSIAVPAAIAGVLVLAGKPWFWEGVYWLLIACVAVVILFLLGAGLTELWRWFRRDGWKTRVQVDEE